MFYWKKINFNYLHVHLQFLFLHFQLLLQFLEFHDGFSSLAQLVVQILHFACKVEKICTNCRTLVNCKTRRRVGDNWYLDAVLPTVIGKLESPQEGP